MNIGSIEPNFRNGFRSVGSKSIPKAISAACGFCGEVGVFTLNQGNPPLSDSTWATFSKCPSCDNKSDFFVAFEKLPDGNMEPIQVSVFPGPSNSFEPLRLPSDFSSVLAGAIRDAEESLKNKLYSPALTCGGRALEAVFYELGKKHGSSDKLYSMIEKFLDSPESNDPLRKLAHAIRKGRNVGAHFDVDIQPTKDSAILVVELLHYLVTYFFLLPAKINALETLLGENSSSED